MEEGEEKSLKSHEVKAKHQQARRDQWFNNKKGSGFSNRICHKF